MRENPISLRSGRRFKHLFSRKDVGGDYSFPNQANPDNTCLDAYAAAAVERRIGFKARMHKIPWLYKSTEPVRPGLVNIKKVDMLN